MLTVVIKFTTVSIPLVGTLPVKIYEVSKEDKQACHKDGTG
jgi:hypothetical protein